MATITVSDFTTQAAWEWPGSTSSLRIYCSETYHASDGQVVLRGDQGSGRNYLEVLGTVSGGISTFVALSTLRSTTDRRTGSDPRYTVVFCSGQGTSAVERDVYLSDITIPATPSPTTWDAIKTFNEGVHTRFDKETLSSSQILSLLQTYITGSNAPKMTTVINGIGVLFEAALSSVAPIVVGLNSLYVGSRRLMTATQAGAASIVEGTIGKLSNSFRGMIYATNNLRSRFNLGIYNPADFGAVDDGATDNTTMIQAAINAVTASGGGRVRLVQSANGTGVFRHSGALVMNSHVTLEGDGYGVGHSVRLEYTGSGHAVEVGQNLVDVTIRNITLKTSNPSSMGTTGIKFVGDGSNATQILTVEKVSINGFEKGVAVQALDAPRAWQCSYGTLSRVTVQDCMYGLYFDAINSDWNISDPIIYGRLDSFGIYIVKSGTLIITHPNFLGPAGAGAVCSFSVPNPAFSDTAIYIVGQHGPITVSNGQAENFRDSLSQNYADTSNPIVWSNNVMGAPIKLNASTYFISHGNQYYDDTVRAYGDSRIASSLDWASTLNTCLDAGTGQGGFVLNDNATLQRFDNYGFHTTSRMFIGNKPNADDPTVAATPTFMLGSSVAQKVLAYINRAAAGVPVVGYKIKLDANDILRVDGTQAAPNNGVATTGFLESAGGAGVVTGAAGTVRSFFNGSFWQVFINGGTAKNPQVSSVAYTAGAIPKQLSNGEQGASVLREDAGSIKQSSGNFVIESATGQIISNATTGTAPITVASTTKVTNLNADKLDGKDWAAPDPLGTGTPAAATFTTIAGTTGTFSSTISGTAITGTTSVTSPIHAMSSAEGAGTLVEQLLATNAAVDLNTATATTLFTCPASRSCIITKIIIDLASTSLTTASFCFGWVSAGFNDVIITATHTTLTGATIYETIPAKVGARIGTASETFKTLNTILQGAAATCRMRIFGIVFTP
jgi:hypothetical protein